MTQPTITVYTAIFLIIQCNPYGQKKRAFLPLNRESERLFGPIGPAIIARLLEWLYINVCVYLLGK